MRKTLLLILFFALEYKFGHSFLKLSSPVIIRTLPFCVTGKIIT